MSTYSPDKGLAQVVLHTSDLPADIGFFSDLGFRLDNIFPADDPQVAMISGFNIHIRLDRNVQGKEGLIHIQSDLPRFLKMKAKTFLSPGGIEISFFPKTKALEIPETSHKFEVRKKMANEPWVIGRAGMLYRDLIPDRLGGSIIASHIHIPEGGPVPDLVHYHSIGFQLIFCYKGWVRLVYEDQGPPFILEAGDCVTQPPEIRHRVLESSDDLEVVEIGIPADHMTTIDHDMELPNKKIDKERLFQGQKFCRHRASEAVWKEWLVSGYVERDSGVDIATKGLASVKVVKSISTESMPLTMSHDADILFRFIMNGHTTIVSNGNKTYDLFSGEAYVLPPGYEYKILYSSADLEFLEVSLPGRYQTSISK